MKDKKLIAKFMGGSQSYGLSTPESDEDVRGVFLHTDPFYIIGLGRYEHVEDIKDGNDIKYKEFRAFVNLLRKGNTEAVEMLFLADERFEILTEEMVKIRQCKYSLIEPEKLFKVLLGYMQGEKRLMNGERTGKLGSKRKNAIDKYGFSPKSATQLFRLAWAGRIFFNKGYFPVNIREENEDFANYLMAVKTNPERFTKEELNAKVNQMEKELKEAFDSRKNFGYEFSDVVANDLVCETYTKVLDK